MCVYVLVPPVCAYVLVPPVCAYVGVGEGMFAADGWRLLS